MTNDEQAMVVHESAALDVWRESSPSGVVAQITDIANVLKDVIRQNKLTSNISGREYVRVEGWTLIAPLIKAWPSGIPEIRPLVNDWCEQHYPAPCGYEARVELRRDDGTSVGGGVAECTKHERTWANRDDYALKSMAQTRAVGKAYRMSFGFVMAAAGYETAVAEEMPDEGDTQRSRPQGGAARGASSGPSNAAPAPGDIRTVGDVMNLGRSLGFSPAEIKQIVGQPKDVSDRGLAESADLLRRAAESEQDESPASPPAESEPIEAEFSEVDEGVPAYVDSVASLLAWAQHSYDASPEAVAAALGVETTGQIAAAVQDQYGGEWGGVVTTLIAEFADAAVKA